MADELNPQSEPASDKEMPEWLEEASSGDSTADDEFDRLRERTALASEMYEEMEEMPARGGSGGFFSRLTPGQRFIISILILLNVVVIIIGFLVITGRIVF